MKKLRVLIADDEAPSRSRMSRMAGAIADLEVVGEAANGLEALEQIAALQPDIVFLDIDMPELSGIEVARCLSDASSAPAVIFVTAYDTHALEAFELSALDYLVKPVAEARLQAAVEKVRRRPTRDISALLEKLDEKRTRRLAVKCGSRYAVFDPKKIAAVIARDHYAELRVDGRELLADDSLESLAAKLDQEVFLRVHRSALINVEFLRELEHEGDRKYVAVLSDPARTRVPISREKLSELKSRLGLS